MRANHEHSRSAMIWLAILTAIVVGVFLYWPHRRASARNSPNGKNTKGQQEIPVMAVRAHKGDIGVYFNGLGAVTPIYTVTVKSRVDGELMNVMYREGDLVKKRDLLVEIDPRPYEVQLEQAEGALIRDQAALENARTDLTRYETLIQQNAIPEQQLATQKATVTQDEGLVKADQGQIDSAKLNLVYTKITAPITGLIGLRLVDPGNIVHATDTNGLVVITQVDPISVLFTVAEDQLPVVLRRMRLGKLTVDAYDRDLKQKLASGTLEAVDNQIDQTTGTVRLRALFENKDSALFPNQFVNARLLVQEKRGVVLIPTAAVQRNSNTAFVFLVTPESRVTVRNVGTGVTEGDNTEVTSGLQAGDTVVMAGVDKLQEGSQVQTQIQGESGNGQLQTTTGQGKQSQKKSTK